jgi:hypothetical protein
MSAFSATVWSFTTFVSVLALIATGVVRLGYIAAQS